MEKIDINSKNYSEPQAKALFPPAIQEMYEGIMPIRLSEDIAPGRTQRTLQVAVREGFDLLGENWRFIREELEFLLNRQVIPVYVY